LRPILNPGTPLDRSPLRPDIHTFRRPCNFRPILFSRKSSFRRTGKTLSSNACLHHWTHGSLSKSRRGYRYWVSTTSRPNSQDNLGRPSADCFCRRVRSAITLNSPIKSSKVQHRLRVCTVICFDQRDLIVSFVLSESRACSNMM
jgi:hypothetical protein